MTPDIVGVFLAVSTNPTIIDPFETRACQTFRGSANCIVYTARGSEVIRSGFKKTDGDRYVPVPCTFKSFESFGILGNEFWDVPF